MFAERLICSWIGALGLAAGAFCQTYVGISPSPSYDTYPYSINVAGVISGSYSINDGLGPFTGFVRDAAGMITTFNVPGLSTDARSINANGGITGSYVTFGTHGFVRDPFGNFTSFDADPDPGAVTYARSINARGDVTGYYSSSPISSTYHGFLREDNGAIIAFDPAGSKSTTALSINAVGAITGYYQRTNGRVHGFVRHPTGHVTSFDPPESTGTYPASINYAGAITGYYAKANGRTYGFVRDAAGKITSFDPGINTNPTSINDQGVIVGAYAGNTGSSGFLRSPGGTITLLNAPNVCGPSILQLTSINEGGVVTGWCSGEPTRGWVRFP